MNDTGDIVTLSIPRNPAYYGVARLVVGGLAAGLSLSYDALDDLQLAIGSLLDSNDLPVSGDLTLQLSVDTDRMRASLGAFEPDSVERALQRNTGGGDGEAELGLRRLLDTIVDEVSVEARDGHEWVTLTKRVKAAAV